VAKRIDSRRGHEQTGIPLKLKNAKKDITVEIFLQERSRDEDGVGPWVECLPSAQINGVEVDASCAKWIKDSWNEISEQIKETKRVAAAAKKNMEDNETKWNLAEKLLEMKRTESGALVPYDWETNNN
jgi:hypothetical protein